MKTPHELDVITDVVLAYKPKPKTKAAKKRIRRKKSAEKNQKRESSIRLCGGRCFARVFFEVSRLGQSLQAHLAELRVKLRETGIV